MRLGKIGRGWYAAIEIPAPAGCQAKVASDFGKATPSEAVDQMMGGLASLRSTFAAPVKKIAA